MNNIGYMPDAYKKTADGQLYKLLELENYIYSLVQTDYENIKSSRDIRAATGKTLDRYGEMVGITRGGVGDIQMLFKILVQIGINTSGGDIQSIIDLVAQFMNVQPSDIQLREGRMRVDILGFTIEQLERTGYPTADVWSMIGKILPAGIALGEIIYSMSHTLEVETKIYEYLTDFQQCGQFSAGERAFWR